MAKYDWIKLEREFTTHKKYATISLRSFAEEKGIPYGSNFREHTEGWLAKRAAKRSQNSRKIEERLQAQEIATEEEINRRHLQAYNTALDAIEKILREQLSLSVDMFGQAHETGILSSGKLKSTVQALEMIQKGQRLCLGMDKDFDPQAQSDETAIDAILSHLHGRLPKGDNGD